MNRHVLEYLADVLVGNAVEDVLGLALAAHEARAAQQAQQAEMAEAMQVAQAAGKAAPAIKAVDEATMQEMAGGEALPPEVIAAVANEEAA